jgi:hypothetical protein
MRNVFLYYFIYEPSELRRRIDKNHQIPQQKRILVPFT